MEYDRISLLGTPEIPGLVFRHFQAPGDFQAMAEITRASAVVDGTERADTAKELEAVYAHLTNCDVSTDFIAAEVPAAEQQAAPELIGYSRVTWRDEAKGGRSYLFFGRVTPAWRHKGVGGAMLAWIGRACARSQPVTRPRSKRGFCVMWSKAR